MNLAHFLFFLLLTACFMKFGGCIVRMFTTVTQIGVDPGLLIGCVCVCVCVGVCVCVCVCVFYLGVEHLAIRFAGVSVCLCGWVSGYVA